jgi:hypothetical protein
MLLALAAAAAPTLAAWPTLADPPKGPAAKGSASASAAASASASASAAAPIPSVSADIMVLHASNSGGGIDPRLEKLPQLKKPPFSSYDTYKLLTQTRVPLALGKPSDAQLPNGRALRVTLKDVPETNRFKVGASITKPSGKEYLPLLEVTAPLDEPFFVAGQSHEKGILVVGIKVVK